MRLMIVSCCAAACLTVAGASTAWSAPGRDPGLRGAAAMSSPVTEARRRVRCGRVICRTRKGKRECYRPCWEVQPDCPGAPDCR